MKKIIIRKLKQYPLLQPYLPNIILYLRGQKNDFITSQTPPGSSFQQSVWQACQLTPYGATISYSQLAAIINCSSAQAVGTALKNNPLPIVIPCHRIIKSDGEFGQYALGSEIKQWLIKHELSLQ